MALDAYALVVGVDAYQNGMKLSGCVKDAHRICEWLLSIDVPPDQIWVNVGKDVDDKTSWPTGVHLSGAQLNDIWKSTREIQQRSGDLRFVFFSGHGFALLEGGPVFLASDWSEADSSNNVSIDEYAKYFLGGDIRRTLIVMDTCQNRDAQDGLRSRVRPGLPKSVALPPRPSNEVLVCRAARDHQFVPGHSDGGVLITEFIRALTDDLRELPTEARGGVRYDWQTGAAQLDFLPIFRHVIAPGAQKRANDDFQYDIDPNHYFLGHQGHRETFLIHDLSLYEPVDLHVQVQPVEGLSEIVLRHRFPEVVPRVLNSNELKNGCFKGRVPKGQAFEAVCRPAKDWKVDVKHKVIDPVEGEVTISYQLSKSDPPPGTGEEIQILTVDSSGGSMDGIGSDTLGGLLGGEGGGGVDRANTGEPYVVKTPKGISIFPNGAPAHRVGAIGTDSWRRLSKRSIGAHQNYGLVLADPFAIPMTGNLKLEVDPSVGRGLAVILSTTAIVRVTIASTEPDTDPVWLSATQIGLSYDDTRSEPIRQKLHPDGSVPLGPGTYQIDVNLPWSSIQTYCEVDSDQMSTVKLNLASKTLPLRYQVFSKGTRHSDREPIESQIIVRRFDPRRPESVPASAVHYADELKPPTDTLLILRRTQTASESWEPFSDIPHLEWDQLVVMGDLRGVKVERCLQLMKGMELRPDTDMFKLAVGYAAISQSSETMVDVIGEVRARLSPWFSHSLDSFLLSLRAREAELRLPDYSDFDSLRMRKALGISGRKKTRTWHLNDTKGQCASFKELNPVFVAGAQLIGRYFGVTPYKDEISLGGALYYFGRKELDKTAMGYTNYIE